MDVSKRIGKFTATREFIQDTISNDAIAKELFGNFYPIKCIIEWDGMMNYVGFSPLFDEIEEGTPPPEYLVAMAATQLQICDWKNEEEDFIYNGHDMNITYKMHAIRK